MHFHSVIAEMRRAVVRHEEEFARGKERQPALTALPTLHALLAKLPLSEDVDPVEKHAITMALIKEFGAARSPLWSALLLIAYEPLLVVMGKKAIELPPDERRSLVVTSFLEAAKSASSHDYVRSAPGFLKTVTTFNVMHTLTTEAMQSDVEMESYDEDLTCADMRAVFENPLDEIIDHCERLELARARSTPANVTQLDRTYWRVKKAQARAAKRAQGAK
jgi:hypothetical protein